MCTKDAVRKWVESRGTSEKHKIYRANSCFNQGDMFYSYSTPIAFYTNGMFKLNKRKYSVTTSRLQNILRCAIPSDKLVEVDKIER